MARVLIVGGFLALVFWVFSIVDCAVQPAMRHRGASKGAWIAIVVLLPVLGGILWFALGRRRRRDQESIRQAALTTTPSFCAASESPNRMTASVGLKRNSRAWTTRQTLRRLSPDRDGVAGNGCCGIPPR